MKNNVISEYDQTYHISPPSRYYVLDLLCYRLAVHYSDAIQFMGHSSIGYISIIWIPDWFVIQILTAFTFYRLIQWFAIHHLNPHLFLYHFQNLSHDVLRRYRTCVLYSTWFYCCCCCNIATCKYSLCFWHLKVRFFFNICTLILNIY